jgi:ParB-like chromosome segregation protein Spo0J
VLAEIGYADALLARELDDGTLELIDGHLRAETTPDMQVPVLVLDVDESEANKLLATLDPLAAMAGASAEVLRSLRNEVHTENEAVKALLDAVVASENKKVEGLPSRADLAERPIPESYQVVVECRDEQDQQSVYERLTAEGYHCRVLTL